MARHNECVEAVLGELELSFDALLDLTSDLQQQVVDLQAKLKNLRVTVSFDELSTAAPAEVDAEIKPVQVIPAGGARRARGSRQGAVLAQLADGRWHAVADMIKATGIPQKNVGACLSNLKREGRVENGLRGQWQLKTELQLASG